MQRFTIRDIEHMCGIKAHTFRIWEQRYDMFTPKRKESQHRYYDNDDLKRLLQISFLYHQGMKVSKIAELSEEEIIKKVQATTIQSASHEQVVLKLLEAAIDFDEVKFNSLLDDVIAKEGFENCVTEVCYPFLNRTGLLWMTSNVIPAQEHFSSHIIQNRIIAETNKLPKESSGNKILLFTPKGEHHEMPLLFINFLMKKNGCSTIYLGCNMEIETVASVALDMNVQQVFLYLITNFTGFDPQNYLQELAASFEGKRIIAAGAAFSNAHSHNKNILLLKTDKEVRDFITATPSEERNSSRLPL